MNNFEPLREELARVNSNDTRTTGRWSTGQIFYHLAAAFEGSVDGLPPGYPQIVRNLIRPFRWVVTRIKFPPWIPIPSTIRHQLEPPMDADETEQYNRLLQAIARFESQEGKHPPHPVLGLLSQQEWIGFHLRHCQHHLAFIQTHSAEHSDEVAPKRARWRWILVFLAVLLFLGGMILPALQPARESGPHPKRHNAPASSDLEMETIVD